MSNNETDISPKRAINESSTNDTTWIYPPSGRFRTGLSELSGRYELIAVMIWREILLRYKQTLIGWGWVMIQPFITMGVFVIVFERAMKVETDIPYTAFALSGLVVWIFFTHSLTKSSISILSESPIVKKISFPRLVIPISVVLAGLVDFLVMFCLLVIVLLYYHIPFSINFLFWPVFLGIVILAALGLGFWLAAINTHFHDINNLLPFALQTGLFITPIGYPLSQIPEEWHFLIGLNPLVGAIEGFRWSVLNVTFPDVRIVAASVCISVVLFISGLYFFRRREAHFGDII